MEETRSPWLSVSTAAARATPCMGAVDTECGAIRVRCNAARYVLELGGGGTRSTCPPTSVLVCMNETLQRSELSQHLPQEVTDLNTKQKDQS